MSADYLEALGLDAALLEPDSVPDEARALNAEIVDRLSAAPDMWQFPPPVLRQLRLEKASDTIVGDPERGGISPGDFIDVAGSTGLIVPIGAWVLEEACKLLSEYPDLHLSVNVSVQQFLQEDFVRRGIPQQETQSRSK